MLILKAQNVVSEGIPIVYVYQMHQQNGSFAQNVDSEDIPGSTNGVNKKARNNKLYGDRAPPTSTNVLIYKMGWPPRLQFLAPFHISCNPDINKVGNRSYMLSMASSITTNTITKPNRSNHKSNSPSTSLATKFNACIFAKSWGKNEVFHVWNTKLCLIDGDAII